MSGVAIVTTTVGSEGDARTLARALVEARLAACVQIMPVQSVYRWDGSIEDAHEQLLICKIASADFVRVQETILAQHAYDIPEIVMMPVAGGYEPYVAWIGASVTR